MNTLLKSAVYIVLLAIILSCQDYLDIKPKGVLTDEFVGKIENVEGLVIAAYSFIQKKRPCCEELKSLNPWIASVRSDDAYKGGGGLDDQSSWYQMEVFSLVSPSVNNNNGVWKNGYYGISRANTAISKLKEINDEDFALKQTRIAEMRFLRGWLHFKLKMNYKWIPYITDGLSPQEIKKIPNRPDDATNDLEIWQKIYEDFKFASENLPEKQNDVGRINKYGAKAYLVHALMWMAYEQDMDNKVVNVNKSRLEEALQQTDDIINSGLYSLAPDFSLNFMYNTFSPEVIWALQFSVDDGTPYGNLNAGNSLTAPWWSPYFSCCDFHKPSYNMVNAFKVDENGLPLFETFNDQSANNNPRFFKDENSFDPRIGHTVAIPGLPWKYQNQSNPVLFDSTASRQSAVYGYFHSMKENVRTDSPGLVDLFWMFNSKDQAEVRYDEVLLWKAEILIELGREKEALPIINDIRRRAGQSTAKLVFENGTPTLDYQIGLYEDGVNVKWTQDFARKALRWERRLEFAMEGRRFFDLVRWGIAEETMDAYFAKEKKRRPWLEIADFTSGRDEFRPIPQAQVNLSEGAYVQNPGY